MKKQPSTDAVRSALAEVLLQIQLGSTGQAGGLAAFGFWGLGLRA